MKDLIDKLAKATAPCRALDRAIYEAAQLDADMVKYEAESWFCATNGSSHGFNTKHGNPAVEWCGRLPSYTGSLDAALTLVPDSIEQWDVCFDTYPIACVGRGENGAKGATPAIALCIAALRARADQQTGTKK